MEKPNCYGRFDVRSQFCKNHCKYRIECGGPNNVLKIDRGYKNLIIKNYKKLISQYLNCMDENKYQSANELETKLTEFEDKHKDIFNEYGLNGKSYFEIINDKNL